MLFRSEISDVLAGFYVKDDGRVNPHDVTMESFRADRAILTIAALDPVFGAMDADLDEAQIARAMIRNSQSLTILADATKFGRHAAHVICAADAIDLIISDGKMEKALQIALIDKGVTVWT